MQISDPYTNDESTKDPYNYSADKFSIYRSNARKMQEEEQARQPTYSQWKPDMYTRSQLPSRNLTGDEADEVASRILGLFSSSGRGGLSQQYRFAVDTIMAMALNKPYNEVASNHDLYMMSFTGEKIEDKTFIEAFMDRWNADGVNSKIARLQNRLDRSKDDEEKNRLESDIEELELELVKLGDYTDRGWLQSSAISTAPVLKQVGQAIMITAVTSGLGHLIGGAGLFAQGLGNGEKAISSLSKAWQASASVKAGQIGRKVGTAINMLNTFETESGSISRELYTMTDENGNRISDKARIIAKNVYGLIATAIEYFTPEVSFDNYIKSKAGKKGLKSAFMKSIKGSYLANYAYSNLKGGVSESLEEALQSITSSVAVDLAKAYSDSTGKTSFGKKSLADGIAEAMQDGFNAFAEAFVPSIFAGAIPNVLASAHETSQFRQENKINKDVAKAISDGKGYIPESDKPISELRKSAKKFQDFGAGTEILDIDNIEIKSESPTKDYFASTDDNPSGKIGTINVRPSDKTMNQWVGATEEDRDKIKALYDKGANGVAVIKQTEIDTTISDADFGRLIENMKGYATDTEVHFQSEEDLTSFVEHNSELISFDEKERTISFLSDNGKNTSLNVEIDSNEAANTPTLSENAKAISDKIMRASEGTNISKEEANLLGELLSSIPSLNKKDLVAKDSDIGISLAENNAMGASDLESIRIILSEDSTPATVLHEGTHLMIKLNPAARMELKKATYGAVKNAKELHNLTKFVRQNLEIYHGKSLSEIMEVFKSIDNKTDALTTEQEEVLVDTHTGYARSNSGKFLPETIKRIFNRLASSFRKIYRKATGKALLPTDMEKAYSSFYSQENDTINTGENYGSQRAIREGHTDRGRDGFGSQHGRETGYKERANGLRSSKGLPKGTWVSKGADTGLHHRHILLDSILKKIDPDSHAVEFRQLDNSNPEIAKKFKAAIDNARKTQPYGLYVDSYGVDTSLDGNEEHIGYSDPRMRLFMSEDESVGFAIKDDGDIVSVFSDKTKGNHQKSIYSILLSAIENGGTKLDCYGKRLLQFYMQMGFEPQGKVAYNDSYETAEWKARKDILGEPEVYALYWNDNSIDETLKKLPERLETITKQEAIDIANSLNEYSDILSEPIYGYDRLIEARDESLSLLERSKRNGNSILYQRLLDSDALKDLRKKLSDFTEEDIGLLVDNNVYVPESILKNHIGSRAVDIELDERRTIGMLVSDSDKETAMLSPNLRSFIEKMKAEKKTDWSDNMERLYTKYYIYEKTLTPSEMRSQFIREHKTLEQLLSLKQALTERRVFYKGKDGKLTSRIYVPKTSYTYSLIANLTKDSPEAAVNNILKSIEKDTNIWIKSYIRATMDYERLSAMTTGSEAWLRSMAQIGYLALADSEFGYLETLRLASPTADMEYASDLDSITKEARNLDEMSFSQDYSSTAVEGEREAFDMMVEKKDRELYKALENEALKNEEKIQNLKKQYKDSIKRLKEEHQEDLKNLRLAEKQKQFEQNEEWKEKYKGKAYIDRWARLLSEKDLKALYAKRIDKLNARYMRLLTEKLNRRIRRGLNVNLSTHDTTLVDVSSYLYDAMHDSENKSEYAITEDNYDSKRTRKGTEADTPDNVVSFTHIVYDADGQAIEQDAEMQMGETRYDRKNIPNMLSKYLAESSIEELRDTSKSWKMISYETKQDIAKALNFARSEAKDIMTRKKAIAANRRHDAAMETASSILKSTPELTNEEMEYIAGKLNVDIDSNEFHSIEFKRKAERYYIENMGLIDAMEISPAKDIVAKAKTFFGHFQRFARYLDGQKEGAIYKHFVLDPQKSLDEKARNIERRNVSADEEISRILSDGNGKNRGFKEKNKQYTPDKAKLDWLKTKVEVKSNSMKKNTKSITGYQMIGAYMYSQNIHGFIKLLSTSGNNISLESLAKINPEYTLKFINEDLKQRAQFDEMEEERRANAEKRGKEYKRQNHQSILYTEDIETLAKVKNEIESGNIKQGLPEFAIELGDTLINLLSKETERLEKSAYELYNSPFKMQENYVPLYSMYGSYREKDVNSSSKGNHSVFKGMLQDRQLARDYALMLDPFSVYRTAVDEQETMINMGGIVSDLNYLMDEKGGNLKQIVSDQFGSTYAKILESQIEVYAGRRESLVGYEGAMNLLLANASISALGWNVLNPVKQLLSFFTSISHGDISLRDVVGAMVKHHSDADRFDEIYKEYAPDIASSTISLNYKMAKDSNSIRKYNSKYARVLDKSMQWIEMADQYTKKITWLASFNKDIKNGMSESDAAIKATQLIKETQSVSNKDSLSASERNKNPFVRSILAFSRDTFQFWNILAFDIPYDLKNKQFGKAAEKFLGIVAVAGSLALLQGGWLPEDDEKGIDWRQLFTDALSQGLDYVPILGIAGLSQGFDGWDSQLISLPREIGRLIRMPPSEKDYTAEEYLDQMMDIGISGVSLTGLPTTSAKRAFNTFFPDGVEDGLGFNPAYLLGTSWGNANFRNLMD